MSTIDPARRTLLLPLLTSLLSSRTHPKTICPSEVPRSLSSTDLASLHLGAKDWRELMDDVRELVWEMRERGEVEVMQKGSVIGEEVTEWRELKGPIRVRLKR